MRTKNLKSCLSLLLAMVMLLSMMPVQAFAEETHDHDHAEELTEHEHSYKEEIVAPTAEAEGYTRHTCTVCGDTYTDSPVAKLEPETQPAETEDASKEPTRVDGIAPYASKTVSVLDGQVTVTDTFGNGSVSGGTVTVKATGSTFKKATNTITIANATDNKALLSFAYSASNYNSFTIAGKTASASGKYSAPLGPGESITLVLEPKKSTTATLTLSDFKLLSPETKMKATVNFDGTLGSVTIDGTAVSSGAAQEIPISGAQLVATANSGSSFIAWTDADDKIISTDASYNLITAEDTILNAVFVSETAPAYFRNGDVLSTDLNALMAMGGTVMLAANGTLTGSYTVPSGVTLLIPDAEEAADGAKPTLVHSEKNNPYTWAAPTAYRTLHMAEGASLTIASGGKMEVSAKVLAAVGGGVQPAGAPVEAIGFVKMAGGSKITVESGGKLYAWGYITGSGSVEAQSGAEVFELFQFNDFRGGSQSSDMQNGVFPINQYYIQNIEVPLTLYSGATETAYTAICSSGGGFLYTAIGTSVSFLAGSGAMFNLTSGYVVKRYDGSSDRLVIDAYGDLSINSITMRLATISIDSSQYELPLNSNLTINIHSGTISIGSDLAIMPGARLTIDEGAKCVLKNNVNVYVYDADQWGNFAFGKQLNPVKYAPGKSYTRSAADLVDAAIIVNGELDASNGYLYTTASGANVSGSGVISLNQGTETKTYMMAGNGSYTEIPITNAQLKNDDGSYTSTATGTYTKTNGVWSSGHVHSYDAVVTAPTCTEQGYTTHTCSGCGDSYVDTYVDALGHTEVIDAAVAATCTETGLTEGKHCSVCGYVLFAQELIPAKGHTEVIDEAKEATCTETGLTEGKHCSVCDEVLVAQEVVPAKGHTEVIDEAKEATCTETGLTEGKHCSVCDEVLVAQEVVPAKGHTEVIDAAVAATCTETGLTEGKHCSVCDEILVAQKTTEKNPDNHTGEEVWTRTADKHSKAWNCCGKVTVEEAEHTWKDGSCSACGYGCLHVKVTDAAVAPTCTETGLTEGKHCSVCGYVLIAQQTVDALGHDYGSVVTAPTCTEQGFTTHTCSRCNDSYTDSYVDAKGHTEVIDAAVAATCTETGLTEGKHCSVCGDVLVAQQTVDALGHDYGSVVTAPTCTEQGFTTHTCSRCNDSYTDSYVDATGHTVVVDPAKEATCTETGLTEGKHCSVCNEVLVAQEKVAALGHDYEVKETVAPTCTEKGHTTYTCSRCNDTYFDDILDELGHDLIEEEEFPASCTTDGHTAGSYCSRCDYLTWTVLKATGHTMIDVEAKKPTYANVGWNAYQQCSVCGYKEGYEEIPKLDEPVIDNYQDFITNLALLEELAYVYVQEHPGKDPLELVIKYIRTGVDRYNSGSWGIMAGYENADFATFVSEMVDSVNSEIENEEDLLKVTGLKNIENFTLPNGDTVDFGHMFGTMDITYHNNGSMNHADVGGWAGDVVDLLSASDRHGASGTVEEMALYIRENILGSDLAGEDDKFSQTDIYGDLDALYIMTTLENTSYEMGTLTAIMEDYFTESLTMDDRAAYFLKNRLDGVTLRNDVREAVYSAYTGNKVIATLEGTRNFENEDISDLRRACCYAFADYICQLAGDYVDQVGNDLYTVFSSETVTLAPGITQQVKYATSADGKQMAYFIATADITRDDVHVYANYNNNDPSQGWAMQRVLDQAKAAQAKYSDPNSENYIENYNVIVSVNASGFNMSTGEPSGLLVMNGIEYHPISASGFFGILKDGTPVVGTQDDYNGKYKGQVQEAVEIFGTTLIKDGKLAVTNNSDYYTSRAPRAAVGYTATGKVVMMVLDGRQEPYSCGGTMAEIAQIMFEAGCVWAVNLDGGGSTTYVAKQPGEELDVFNSPSDGFARSVAATLMMVSTAPSSTEFKYAAVDSDYDYLTAGSTIQLTAKGISATGEETELPEGTYWAVSDENCASITEDGKLTGLRNGTVTVDLMLDGESIGSHEVSIVTPENVYFTKESINVVFGQSVVLPVKVLYNNKEVAVQASDLTFTCSEGSGTIDGFIFTASESTALKSAKITAVLGEKSASLTVMLYNQGEVSFDFDQATGGDRQMAWDRVVSNAVTDDEVIYWVVDPAEDMVTGYTFAIDMSQIPIPERLNDLIYMLPGADASNASAWGFMMQLAERISDLSEVKTIITFDKRVDVDYSDLKLVNDYFELKNAAFDETTNSLTLTMNWKKQTQALDVETANPLCIVSGIKLTPKQDADWGADSSLTIANQGTISYKIYMRASALYSFCQKEENQQTYGLYPYVHPEDATEKGGWFGDVYSTFEDSYTLTNAVKNGWIIETDGYAYYDNGQRLTGIQQVDGLFYDFGGNGINAGKNPYTGLFEQAGKLYYAKLGVLTSGWVALNAKYYYFDETTFQAHTGESTIGKHTYTFNDDGVLIFGAFETTDKGTRYYWAGTLMTRKWIDVESVGRLYANDSGYIVYGNYPVKENATEDVVWMEFDEETGAWKGLCNGFITYDGNKYYCVNGEWFYGAVETGNGLVFCSTNGIVKMNGPCYISNSLEVTAGLENGYYWCDENGYIQKDGFATINDSTYFFTDYVRAKGFTKIGEDYYFFNAGNGKMQCNATLWVSGNNPYGIASGYYTFQEDGTMYIPDPNGEKKIIEQDGKLYFTIDGVKQTNGLNELDGEYYYANSNGVLAVNTTIWISSFNNLIAPGDGYFAFDENGRLIKTGFVTGGGDTYYYDNLVRVKGFTKIGEDYYFFNAGSGKMQCNKPLWVSGSNPYGIKSGTYYFGEDGKMIIE